MLSTVKKRHVERWLVLFIGVVLTITLSPQFVSSAFPSPDLPGWHWYNEVLEEERENPPIEIADFLLALSPEQLKYVPIDGLDLDQLPTEVLKVLIEAKKVRALDSPDVEVVTDYFKVQKAAFDRSRKFTDMWALALYTQPELDFHTTNPTSGAGHTIRSQMVRGDEDALLHQVKDEAGLFFFFTSTCGYCQQEAKILKSFSDSFGWKVFPVTVDGKGLPEFPDPQLDNGMGEQLGVSYYPTILLSLPGDRYLVKVGAGFLTLEDIRVRVLQLLQQREEIPHHLRFSGVE